MDDVKVFAPQDLWDNDFSKFGKDFKNLVNYNDGIVKLIYKHIPQLKENENKHFYEIGCYMARYMYHFGKLGYTLHGIDQSPDMDQHFTDYLLNEKFKVGELTVGSVFDLKPEPQYDFVASFGFIEHFSNFLELIDLHFALAKKGATILITIPNLGAPVQYLLHRLVDKEHLDIHNQKALKPSVWREHIREKHEYEVIFDGYTGGFDFWVGDQKRNFFQKALLKAIFLPMKYLRKIKRSHSSYSPYYCLLVKKK